MRIAVYPGSFDPLHIGHLAILEHLSASDEFGMTYLIVSPQSPFKEAEKALNASERLAAAREAVDRHPSLRVTVDDIELRMSAPHYTIRTLDALRAREPENTFVLVVGADHLDCILRWREGLRILFDYGLAVYPREGYDSPALRERLLADPTVVAEASRRGHGPHLWLIDAPLVPISSTFIREQQAAGVDMSEYLM